MESRFQQAGHTIVVSDLHVTDAQVPIPSKPLWKRYKQRDLFIDDAFDRMVAWLETQVAPDSELILNGDVFDFDSVMALPSDPDFPVSWVEKLRGLDAEEPKSCFKMRRILDDHPVFVATLRRWVAAGHRVIVVIGNHDIELHWASVQRLLVDVLAPDQPDSVRFCEWFYVSNGDTLVEHGNQYDRYCLCADPVHPTIRWRGKERVRVPFGNLAERFLLNGMGLFNPHVEDSFIMSLREYLTFFFRYLLRIQPLIAWSWFWGSIATTIRSLGEGFLPSVRDPTRIEQRVRDIARRANSTTAVARGLLAVHVHPAVFTPWRILRELWLDRAAILALLVFGSFQVFSVLNVIEPISPLWVFALFVVVLPPFIFYARTVQSDLEKAHTALLERLPAAVDLAGVHRVVVGHTHTEYSLRPEACELLNTGTWSPAYRDVECTIPFGRKCFAWIRPGEDGQRRADLYEWKDPGCELIPASREPERVGRWLAAVRKARAAFQKR